MSSSIRNASRSRDLRIVVRVATPLIIAALTVGMFLQYRQATSEAKRRFSERQMYQARKAAAHLGEVFREVRKFLALTLDLARRDPEHNRRLLSRVVISLRPQGGVLASRRDSTDGPLLVSHERHRAALEALLPQLPGDAAAPGQMRVKGPIRSSIARSGWVVAALMTDRSAEAAIVLDWGDLQRQISRITKLSRDSYSWVLDQDGRLVMHPEHRDQLGQSALSISGSCSSCHSSFELHRRMTRGLTGAGQIQVAQGKAKLVAFTPFQVGVHRWSLAVATSASLVIADGLRGQTSVFLFFGAIMAAMITGALLLDRESSRRIRTAEAFNRELEREVTQRTEEVRSLFDRLSALQAAHGRLERVTVVGEMASIVAHEIRTPLNALSINAQMIRRLLRREAGSDERSAGRQRAEELLGTLEGEIYRINNLLEDHLLALVRHRKTRLEPLDLGAQVTDAIRFIEPEATRNGVRLIPELAADLEPVRADPAKLRQILLNIILNAIQALPGGGEVRLATDSDGSMATVAIRDNGSGIDASILTSDMTEELQQVFRPFVTTKEDGTGLGLAVCARLIRDMDGRITVRSTAREGACFHVELPLESAGVRDGHG